MNKIFSYFVGKSPFYTRFVLCWGVGILAFLSPQDYFYDLHYKLKPLQKETQPKITPVVVEIDSWISQSEPHYTQLLRYLAHLEPKRVISTDPIKEKQKELFSGELFYFPFSYRQVEKKKRYSYQMIRQILLQDWLQLRKILNFSKPLPTQKKEEIFFPENTFIHYHKPNPFLTYTGKDFFIKGKLSPSAFKHKVVILGSTNSTQMINTPLGPMTFPSFLAQLVENNLNHHWLKRIPSSIYILFLLLALICFLLILEREPQSISLMIILAVLGLFVSISLWLFDYKNIWFPIFPFLVQTLAAWIVFVGYQAMTLEHRHLKLQHEQKALQELEILKSNFVSLISHDLKTPIAKIHAVAEAILATSPSDIIKKEMVKVREASDELNRYIKSILNLARVEAQDFSLHKKPCDINQLIKEVYKKVEPLLESKDLKVELYLKPLFNLELDEALMIEVLMNVVENAMKYSTKSGKIYMETDETAALVQISIKDEGLGIDKGDLDKVFNKFFRGQKQGIKTQGSGMGLYLVKYFVKLHGGHVHLESKKGKGTQVLISIPKQSERGRS